VAIVRWRRSHWQHGASGCWPCIPSSKLVDAVAWEPSVVPVCPNSLAAP
jgi:hypothetical protein